MTRRRRLSPSAESEAREEDSIIAEERRKAPGYTEMVIDNEGAGKRLVTPEW